jgi:hypothetical protein
LQKRKTRQEYLCVTACGKLWITFLVFAWTD